MNGQLCKARHVLVSKLELPVTNRRGRSFSTVRWSPCGSFAQLRVFNTLGAFLCYENTRTRFQDSSQPTHSSLGFNQLTMDGIASAVVLPDPEADSPPPTVSSPTGIKRRLSSTSENDNKRTRVDESNSPTQRRESVSSTKAAAAPPKGRERGRERRLFGAALGALAQNSATAGQKRRNEIEKRQRAQRQLEEEESEQRKQERKARRQAQRWREHRHFEKESVCACASCGTMGADQACRCVYDMTTCLP